MPPHSRIANWSHSNDRSDLEALDLSSSSQYRRNSCKSLARQPDPRPRRIVTFCPFVAVTGIESLDDYTREEAHACWYSDEEIAAIKTYNRKLARASTQEQESMDLRGLEIHMYPISQVSRNIKLSSFAAVLLEQQTQRRAGRTDPEEIRESYMFVTSRLGDRAIDMAQQDALEAQRILHEQSPQTAIVKRQQPRPVCWMFDPSVWFPKRTSYTNLE